MMQLFVTIVKTVPILDKFIRVLWNYVKINDTLVKQLSFIWCYHDCHLNYVHDIGNLILEYLLLSLHCHICSFKYICTPGICFLCIALCGVLCFECCKTPRVLQICCITVVCTVKKISPP
jgi:hypothetical protein